jgi:hypothetical protein
LTRSYKVQRELRKVILKYCQEKYKGEIGKECTWPELIKVVPSLDSEEELIRIEQSLPLQYTSSLISKSKFNQEPPTTLTAWVDTLLSQKLGLRRRTCVEPYRIITTLDNGQTFFPSIFYEEIFSRLAILEFSQRDQPNWSQSELVNLFTVMHNFSVSDYIIFVIFIWPSKPIFCTLLSAMTELGANTATTSTLIQWGSFSTQVAKWVDKRVCVAEQELELIIYFGMSSDTKAVWSEHFPANVALSFVDVEHEDFDSLHSWSDFTGEGLPADFTGAQSKESGMPGPKLSPPRRDKCVGLRRRKAREGLC